MNKTQAKRFAYRWLEGLVEQFFEAPAKKTVPCDPLAYDHWFDEELWGRKLSQEDEELVWEAVAEITGPFGSKGKEFDLAAVPRGEYRQHLAKAKGKPGPKYKGWADYRRRIGFNG